MKHHLVSWTWMNSRTNPWMFHAFSMDVPCFNMDGPWIFHGLLYLISWQMTWEKAIRSSMYVSAVLSWAIFGYAPTWSQKFVEKREEFHQEFPMGISRSFEISWENLGTEIHVAQCFLSVALFFVAWKKWNKIGTLR